MTKSISNNKKSLLNIKIITWFTGFSDDLMCTNVVNTVDK